MTRFISGIAAMLFAAAAAQAQGTLEVLDYGAEPRAPVRYQFKVGKTERSAMDMTMNMSMEMNGQVMPMGVVPPIRLISTSRVVEVGADGSARVEFDTQAAEMELGQPGAGLDLAQLGGLSQLKGWYRIDTSGNVLESNLTLPESLVPAEAQPMLDDLMNNDLPGGGDSLQQFPREAIGIGARWRVTSQQSMGPISALTTEEFTLKSRSGNRVEVGMEVRQALMADAATAAAGVVMGSTGNGMKGTMVVDLEGSMPSGSMEMDSGTDTVIPGQGGGPAQTMRSRMQMRITMAPAPAVPAAQD